MKGLLNLILIILICLNLISGSCNEDQIDINSASKSELDELYGIGPSKAEAIIDERPFDSLDDLINVYGIGEVTLEKIKDQGLACVEEKDEDEKENEEKERKVEEKETYEETYYEDSEIENESKEIILETINLNAKDIKSEKDMENSDKSVYAKYGLGIFCVLLGFLFILKKRKSYKTEFD